MIPQATWTFCSPLFSAFGRDPYPPAVYFVVGLWQTEEFQHTLTKILFIINHFAREISRSPGQYLCVMGL